MIFIKYLDSSGIKSIPDKYVANNKQDTCIVAGYLKWSWYWKSTFCSVAYCVTREGVSSSRVPERLKWTWLTLWQCRWQGVVIGKADCCQLYNVGLRRKKTPMVHHKVWSSRTHLTDCRVQAQKSFMDLRVLGWHQVNWPQLSFCATYWFICLLASFWISVTFCNHNRNVRKVSELKVTVCHYFIDIHQMHVSKGKINFWVQFSALNVFGNDAKNEKKN